MNAEDHGGETQLISGPHATDPHKIRSDCDAYLKQDWNSQILRVKYETDAFNFLSVSGLLYQTLDKANDADMLDDPNNARINPTKLKERQYRQEFRISSQMGPIEWLGGLRIYLCFG